MASNTQKSMSSDVTLLTVRGIAAILFGFAAVFWPGLTIVTLVYLFGAFVLVSGLVGLVASLTNMYDTSHSALSRIMLGLLALLQIGVAVYLIRHPFVTVSTFILIIGFTLLISGVLDAIGGLFDSNNDGGTRMLNIIMGILGVIAGLIVLQYPASSGVAFVWVLGLYALISGPLMIASASSIKNQMETSKR